MSLLAALICAAACFLPPAANAARPGVPVAAERGGTVIAWGDNEYGQTTLPASLVSKTITAVSAGELHSLALTADGTVIGWGNNWFEQARTPASLAGKTLTAIAAGGFHSLALTSEGTVVGWGDDSEGAASVPTSLADKTVSAIAAGEIHSLALTDDGTITSWGHGGYDQRDIPASLTGKTVTAIGAGGQHSLALTTDGTVTVWGLNNFGQQDIPVGLAAKTVTEVVAGGYHSLALATDGTLTAWGPNSGGQGSTAVPATLAGKTITSFAGGRHHSLALTADGVITAWGDNRAGQATVPASLTGKTVTAIDGGGSHSLAITAAMVPDQAPVITGTTRVGHTLTATPGTYNVTPDTLSYQWLRNGTPITGANGATYLLTTGDLNAAISVEVTASSPGYHDALDLSDPVGPVGSVGLGSFTAGPTASITGTLKVGQRLSAGTGTTIPTADRFSYQWFADGQPIAGATGATHTLTAAQTGTVITVQVTASRAGYHDASDSSGPTAQVATARVPQVTLATDAERLRRGQSATLTWSSDDAVSLTRGTGWPGIPSTENMPMSGTTKVRPRALGAHTYRITASNDNGTTTAQVTLKVLREAKKLTVRAPDSRRRGATFQVRARGLDAGERFTIRFGGRAVVTGHADKRGYLTRRITVPRTAHLGKTSVRVVGSMTDRAGRDILRVLPTKN